MTPTAKINYKFREHVHEVHSQHGLGLGGEELAVPIQNPVQVGDLLFC
jgi:hypothetical protein